MSVFDCGLIIVIAIGLVFTIDGSEKDSIGISWVVMLKRFTLWVLLNILAIIESVILAASEATGSAPMGMHATGALTTGGLP
ncbi:MAG: hypothetical protein UHD09_07095 [Bifidobacterium sp.]|nr:hypothetical protein [Bifidobacterium sp.]